MLPEYLNTVAPIYNVACILDHGLSTNLIFKQILIEYLFCIRNGRYSREKKVGMGWIGPDPISWSLQPTERS